jgi:hypothetical protein
MNERTPLERSLDKANATIRRLASRRNLSKAQRRQLAAAKEAAEKARRMLHQQREGLR